MRKPDVWLTQAATAAAMLRGPAAPLASLMSPPVASADDMLTNAINQLARLILGLDNPNPDERPTAEQAGKLLAFFEAADHADQQSMHLGLSGDERDNAIQQAMVVAARDLGIQLKQCSSCQATTAGPGYSDWHEHGGGHLCHACHDEQLKRRRQQRQAAAVAAAVARPRPRTLRLEDTAVWPATSAALQQQRLPCRPDRVLPTGSWRAGFCLIGLVEVKRAVQRQNKRVQVEQNECAGQKVGPEMQQAQCNSLRACLLWRKNQKQASLRFEPLRPPHRWAALAQHVVPPAPDAKHRCKHRACHAPGQHHLSRPRLREEPAG